MSVSNIADCLAENILITKKFRLLPGVEGLGDTEKVLTVDDAPMLILDPEGTSVDVLLPPEADSKGLVFLIGNGGSGTEALVVKDDSDTTTLATITFPQGAVFFCDGVKWYGGVVLIT